MRFPQFFNKAAGKAILGQSSLESVLALQFFALLCREIRFEENFAWIILLWGADGRRGEEKYQDEPGRGASHDALKQRHVRPAGGCPVHWR
jgi:hypothetical protein